MDVDVLGGAFRDLLFYGDRHSKKFLEMPGGTGYNVFAGFRALGINAYFHASVGKDWPFEKLSTLNVVESEKSGVFVSLNENDVLAVYRGANLLAKYEPPRSKILFASLECGGSIFEKYAESVKKLNGTVVLDPSPVLEWKPRYVELCDYLLPNAEEHRVIFKESDSPNGIKIFEKLGSKGGKYLENGKEYSLHTIMRGEFPLGCGDAFDVAVLYGILKNMESTETLEMAIEMGRRASLVCGSSTAVVEAVKSAKT